MLDEVVGFGDELYVGVFDVVVYYFYEMVGVVVIYVCDVGFVFGDCGDGF